MLLDGGWSGLWIEWEPSYAGSIRWTFRDEPAADRLRFVSEYADRDNVNWLIASATIITFSKPSAPSGRALCA
jgi:hypothetical protein